MRLSVSEGRRREAIASVRYNFIAELETMLGLLEVIVVRSPPTRIGGKRLSDLVQNLTLKYRRA